MQCSIGTFTSTPCQGDGLLLISLWEKDNQRKFHLRVKICLDLDEEKIETTCDLHYQQIMKIPLSDILGEEYDFKKIQILFDVYCKDKNIVLRLRPLQAETIFHILKEKDVLCILPTGAGKTIPSIVPGLISARMKNDKSIIIIVQPLINIMEQTCRKIRSYNLKCEIINEENFDKINKMIENSLNGDPLYLVSNPENLEKPKSKAIFRRNKISFFAVDEVHMAPEWAKGFRPAFGRVGNLRTFIEAPISLFSGTITKEMMPEIIESYRLQESTLHVVEASPDRPEIFLEVRTRKSRDKNLEFLANEANTLGVKMPRTIVFVHSAINATDFNLDFRQQLNSEGAVYENGILIDYLSNHLSSSTDPTTSKQIQEKFQDPLSCLRILFTTCCYSMGIDNQSIQRVVLYDNDVNAASLTQKIGRCARAEGSHGQAIIFLSPGMRSLFPKNECIRNCLFGKLKGYIPPQHDELCNCSLASCECFACRCCIVCMKICKCRNIENDNEKIDD